MSIMKVFRRSRGFTTAALLGALTTLAVSLAGTSYPNAQETAGSSAESAQTSSKLDPTYVAPVIVAGDELFMVRGASPLPAVERAEKVAERIVNLAEASNVPAVSVEIKESEYGVSIEVDGEMVTITTLADAEYERMDLTVLAGLQAQVIEEAIIQYRSARSEDARVNSAIAAVAWSVGFLVVTFFFFRKRRAAAEAVAGITEQRFSQVEEATGAIVRGKAVAALAKFAVHVLLWAVYLVVIYYYLTFVLLAFAETRPIAELLLTYVSKPLINIFDGFLSYLPDLITLVIIALVTTYIIKGIRLFFENVEAGTFRFKDFEPHWIAPTYNIARVAVILIALVFAYPYIPGSDSAAFQGLTILAGVMVSLGSNTVVSNMMAGLFVIYRRSTNVGDRIKVGEQIGDVVEIKMMETLIKSIKNEMISIPNAQLLNSEVVNYSRRIDGNGILVHATVGIGYEEPPKKVKAMLIEAAGRTRQLKKRPEPFVLWTELADYAINYQINAYTSRGASLPQIRSDLLENIVEVFNENSTQIMTPSYIADPDVPKIPQQDWDGGLFGKPASTSQVDPTG